MQEKKKIQPYKVEAVAKIRQKLEEYPNLLFTNYQGLSVSDITELRQKLAETGNSMSVVRNRFVKIALRERAAEEKLLDFLVGPVAIIYCHDEASSAAKAVLDFSKEKPISMIGGFVEGKVMSLSEMTAFSKLPTRLELIAKLMGSAQAPAQNLVYALNGVTSKLVRTLAAVRDSKE